MVYIEFMKQALLFASLSIASLGFGADPPLKRGGGFFGFGAPQAPQISSDLFPGEPASLPTAPDVDLAKREGGIFRGGKPEEPAATSYVIENGRRIEKPVAESSERKPAASPVAAPVLAEPAAEDGEKKRGGFFGFGKREEPAGPEAAAAVASNQASPLQAAPVAAPKPIAAPVAVPKPMAAAPDAAAPVETAPAPERGGFMSRLPFLNRKKDDLADPVVASPLPTATPVQAAPAPTVAATTKPAAKPAAKPAPNAPAKPAPTVAEASPKPMESPAPPQEGSAAPEVATFEVRRDPEDTENPKKDGKPSREGGFLPSLPSLPPLPSMPSLPRLTPKKEIDLSQAETIISDGEIVREASPSEASAPGDAAPTATTAAGPRKAPQVVNGVKTYSSWNDVEAVSSSAADKILKSIR